MSNIIEQAKALPREVQQAAANEWNKQYHGRFKAAIKAHPLTWAAILVGVGFALGWASRALIHYLP